MKYLLVINILFLFWSKFNRIAETNALKEEAAIHYENGAYQKSIKLYEKLLTEYKETDETIVLNLANCYFNVKRYNNAIDNYKLLTGSKNLFLKSNSYLQLGVIYSSNNKKELGLSYFKEALKAMPENEEARYNFELLRKDQDKLQKDHSLDKKKENKNGKNSTTTSNTEDSRKTNKGSKNKPSNEPNEEGNGEDEESGDSDSSENDFQYNDTGKKETDLLTSERLEQLNMNERQARMILKTIKSSEEQYLQQRKKPFPKNSISDKPAW